MNPKPYAFLTFLAGLALVTGLFLALVAGASLQELMPALLLLLAACLSAYLRA